MTFKELEALCVKNVAANGDTGFSAETIDDAASNPIYADYVNNVDIHINSAIARLVTSEKTDLMTSNAISYTYSSANYSKEKIMIDVDVTKPYMFKRVYFVDEDENYSVVPFVVMSKSTLLVKNPRTSGNFYVMYLYQVPALNRDLNGSDDMETKYGINDTMCYSYILNYTKSKLWEAEEPELAQTYMNYAETFLAQYESDVDGLQQYEVENEFTYY